MADEAKLAAVIRPQAFIFGDRKARVCHVCGAPPRLYCARCARFTCANHKCCGNTGLLEYGSTAYFEAEKSFATDKG